MLCKPVSTNHSMHNMEMFYKHVLIYAMYSLQRCLPCIFVINVVTSTSMQTRNRDVADFSPCSAVILEMFNKDIL